jgi:hypothetical protein
VCRQETLSADRMKSSKLKRHLERSRANLANNPRDVSDKKNVKRVNDTSVSLNIQPSIYIHLSLLASCKSDFPMQRASYNRRKINHFFLFQLSACNVFVQLVGIKRID